MNDFSHLSCRREQLDARVFLDGMVQIGSYFEDNMGFDFYG